MELLIDLLKTLGMAFILTRFVPLQMVLETGFEEMKTRLKKYPISTSLITNIITLLVTCYACCSFWVGCLIGGFWVGVLAYVIAFFYQARFSGLEMSNIKISDE